MEHSVSIIDLLSRFIGDGKDGEELDGNVASFLYYLFPRELFVRALSLLESNDMFIYCYDSAEATSETLLSKFINTDFLDLDIMYRLIVKSGENDSDVPISVDLAQWFCSCDDFSKLFTDVGNENPEGSIQDVLLKEIDDFDQFSDDKFAQFDSHSLNTQRYLQFEKVMCPHLLAFAILLLADGKNLRHFAALKRSVVLIPVGSIDEWLKLHINIV
ncbi:Shu2p KNAG_0D01850 [Huiozyma naganishii CBS 8797]|uniref:Suppressor of hydroxyurea sensitivity protein 2 n=1 Tax=Huiozyma naganishii (strain ATCC MYA-139 / BCRC 22969 / CBS 8797 / KCTC 17520 / NBRC 10181 / NCYC 3082 / Yp74L-3) TaxID=1071383 RepID=J7S6T0_HUIN7|nr:hypothetical protein KNAG_0D01850 [Kazachstania naganishii CBS 8797]CCK69936.1 hypothetical protein KNAG_0D01850 [Kazachstania naganishii CBS 8797]